MIRKVYVYNMNLIVHFPFGAVNEENLMKQIGTKGYDGWEYTITPRAVTKRLYWYDLDNKTIKYAAYFLEKEENVQYKITNKYNWDFD